MFNSHHYLRLAKNSDTRGQNFDATKDKGSEENKDFAGK